MPRLLTPVPFASLAVGEALARLGAALQGRGDALLPVPVDPRAAARLEALRPGTALLEGEDDDGDPTALVVATSGSTGGPKGAVLPASALIASATATHDRLGGPGTWLLALAPHHVAGVQVLVRSTLAGTTPEVLDLQGGFDIEAFCAATRRLVDRTAGLRYTALVPTQLVRLLDAGPQAVDALASFDAVLLGGAATPPVLLQRAADAGVRVVTTYGMSETCGGCVYDGVPLTGVTARIDTAHIDTARIDTARIDTARIDTARIDTARIDTARIDTARIDTARIDTAGGSSAPDVVGRVRLGGSVVARGYRGRGGSPQFHDDGTTRWFLTNDLGTLDPAGHLTVLGRADDVIVTGGSKVAPQAVEAVISRLDGVLECLVVGVPDDNWGQRVVALVVPPEEQTDRVPTLAEVRHAVRGRLGAPAAPHDVLTLDSLPHTALGKPDRRAASALAARRLSTPHAP